jgi:hypothetical protein
LKTTKSFTVEGDIGGRISRGSGAITSEGLPRENEDLHEVVKRNFNPDVGYGGVHGIDPCISKEEPFR